jgi:hypothetical protein
MPLIKHYYLFFLLSCLLIAPGLRAQEQTYIDAYRDTMNVKLLVTNRGLTTSLRRTSDDERVRFAPDNRSYLGVGGYVWGLGFQVHLPLPLSWFFDETIASESRIFDVQATLYLKQWLLEGIYQSYRNLYPAGQMAFGEQVLNDEIDSRKVQATATYLFGGERVAMRSPYNRNLKQLKSAGSWMFTFGFSSLELQGRESVVPSAYRSAFAPDTLYSDLRAAALLGRPGYIYNLVEGDFFLHASASVGLSLQRKFYRREAIREQEWGLAPVYNFRAALGYDNGRYFAGISGVYYRTYMQADQLRLLEEARNLQLFFGYRFAEPGWISRNKPAILQTGR